MQRIRMREREMRERERINTMPELIPVLLGEEM
jgi:hypothetical protein